MMRAKDFSLEVKQEEEEEEAYTLTPTFKRREIFFSEKIKRSTTRLKLNGNAFKRQLTSNQHPWIVIHGFYRFVDIISMLIHAFAFDYDANLDVDLIHFLMPHFLLFFFQI